MKKVRVIGKYAKIKEIVEKELACSAHDMDHVMRVYSMAMHIAKEEKNVDMDILKAAALLHDIGRVKEDDDSTGKICHAEESARMSQPILSSLGYPDNKIQLIQKCILSHRYKTNRKPESIEEKILFDADKLDSLGAIFIMRAGMWLGRNRCRIFPTMSLQQYVKHNLVGEKMNGRIKNSSLHTIFYEHQTKNKQLVSLMHTKTGKKLAQERFIFVDKFLDRLEKEAMGVI